VSSWSTVAAFWRLNHASSCPRVSRYWAACSKAAFSAAAHMAASRRALSSSRLPSRKSRASRACSR